MFACLAPGEMDREVAAWGLVPAMEATEEELVDVGQPFSYAPAAKGFGGHPSTRHIYPLEADRRHRHPTGNRRHGNCKARGEGAFKPGESA